MAIQISGKLTVASGENRSFEGCHVEAVFDETTSSASGAPTAYCDAAGTFSFLFPDDDELPCETIQLVALSPAGRRIGARVFIGADQGDDVAIEVEPFDPAPHEETPASPEQTAVKGMFDSDAAFRRTLTQNLTPLRAESDAVAHRVERAFATFHTTPLSADGLDARHYVAPDADPGTVLDKVILDGRTRSSRPATSGR